jgi:hypothetical protein
LSPQSPASQLFTARGWEQAVEGGHGDTEIAGDVDHERFQCSGPWLWSGLGVLAWLVALARWFWAARPAKARPFAASWAGVPRVGGFGRYYCSVHHFGSVSWTAASFRAAWVELGHWQGTAGTFVLAET